MSKESSTDYKLPKLGFLNCIKMAFRFLSLFLILGDSHLIISMYIRIHSVANFYFSFIYVRNVFSFERPCNFLIYPVRFLIIKYMSVGFVKQILNEFSLFRFKYFIFTLFSSLLFVTFFGVLIVQGMLNYLLRISLTHIFTGLLLV